MKTHREKYEENNEQLVRVVVKLRKKVANLERKLIEQNRSAQNQHDENVVLKIKLAEKENYAQMMQSSAIELISHNTKQIQFFLAKTGLKIPSRNPKQAIVQTIRKDSHISLEKKPECGQHNNEKSNSYQNKPVRLDFVLLFPVIFIFDHYFQIQLKVFEGLVDRTSSSLSKLSLASDDDGNSKNSNVTVKDKEQRKSFSVAGAMDDETVFRSPVGKKQIYDDEVNESLRILKERKTRTSLAPVADESDSHTAIDQDQKQASTSNHSFVPSMPPTKVVRKRRSEIVPNSTTPVKSIRSDTNLSRAHSNESDGQNATHKEHASKSIHSIKQSISQNVVIRKSQRLQMNSNLLTPVDSMHSNTILARSPTNMDVIKHIARQPNRSHSDDEVVHKHRSRSSHTPEPNDDTDGHADKHPIRRYRTRMSTRSDREQTPNAGRLRRSKTPVDYKKFFLFSKGQE